MGSWGGQEGEVPQTEGFDLVKADAYHWLFIYDLYVEMSLYG